MNDFNDFGGSLLRASPGGEAPDSVKVRVVPKVADEQVLHLLIRIGCDGRNRSVVV